MWTRLMLGLLPARIRLLVELGQRVVGHLDSDTEREAAIRYLLSSIESDGYCSVTEWARFGSMVGIVGRPKS